MDIHLVLKGGHPLHACLTEEEALHDARARIVKTYAAGERNSGKPWGDVPEDPARAVAWWSNHTPPHWRITVQTIPLRHVRGGALKTRKS